MAFEPDDTSSDGWINHPLRPPVGFIAAAMDLAMMAPTKRNGKLVANFAAERAVLGEPQMMGIDGSTAANQTRLLGDESEVHLVANAARFGMRQLALIDAAGN
jgi:hypothetical protein